MSSDSINETGGTQMSSSSTTQTTASTDGSGTSVTSGYSQSNSLSYSESSSVLIDEGETSQVEVTIESKLVELSRASNYRYTDESHKARYAGDTFFSYVQDIQDLSVTWGRRSD